VRFHAYLPINLHILPIKNNIMKVLKDDKGNDEIKIVTFSSGAILKIIRFSSKHCALISSESPGQGCPIPAVSILLNKKVIKCCEKWFQSYSNIFKKILKPNFGEIFEQFLKKNLTFLTFAKVKFVRKKTFFEKYT